MRIPEAEAQRMLNKYPGKVPAVVTTLGDLKINREKYLIPVELTLAEFHYVIRKRVSELNEFEAIYIFIGKQLVPSHKTISEIWATEADQSCLYFKVAKENTFG